jgi:autotransporter-associated beta strand protein
LFNNGSNYAVYDATGYLRALNYSSDSNGATASGGATFGSVGGKDLLMSGAVTAQTSVSINSLKIAADNALTLGASQTLTTNGILKTGGTGTTISGGAGATLQAGSGQDLVIRVDTATDNLTINTAIGANGSNRLIKSGAGNLTLNGAGTYTSTTAVNAGTLTVNSSISGTGIVEIENTGTLAGTGSIGTSTAQTNLRAGGTISPGSNGGTGVGKLRLNGSLTSAGASGINLQLAADGFNASALNSNGTLNTTLLSNSANRVAGANDSLAMTGALTLSAGTAVNVSLTGGYTPKAGDAFDLIDWGTTFTPNGFTYGSGLRTGSSSENAGLDLKLPDLASGTTGLYWDVSQFASSGIIVAVPEPGRACLVGAGLATVSLRRRRCSVREAA